MSSKKITIASKQFKTSLQALYGYAQDAIDMDSEELASLPLEIAYG
jgi:hypothetical protein